MNETIAIVLLRLPVSYLFCCSAVQVPMSVLSWLRSFSADLAIRPNTSPVITIAAPVPAVA